MHITGGIQRNTEGWFTVHQCVGVDGTVSPGLTFAHRDDRSAEALWSVSPRGDRHAHPPLGCPGWRPPLRPGLLTARRRPGGTRPRGRPSRGRCWAPPERPALRERSVRPASDQRGRKTLRGPSALPAPSTRGELWTRPGRRAAPEPQVWPLRLPKAPQGPRARQARPGQPPSARRELWTQPERRAAREPQVQPVQPVQPPKAPQEPRARRARLGQPATAPQEPQV